MWSQALSDSETASTQVRHARQRQSGTLLVPPPRSLLGSLRSSRPQSLASRVALSATLPRRPASAAPQRPSPGEPATAPLSLQPALTPAPDEAAALAQGAPLPAVIDGRYRVEERIGAGGMCLVYRAWQVFLGQARALKVLRDPSLAEERSRLLREARVGAQVQHPNLVRVLDYGVLADGQPYLVMEHLDGITLRRELERGPLPLARALRIAAQIADALGALHEAGYLHRDVKPTNIMLTWEGGEERATLVDLGLCRRATVSADGPPSDNRGDAATLATLPAAPQGDEPEVTVPGRVPGTPQYMAPEQRRGQAIGAFTDQYALGCVLFEMLTGEQLQRQGEGPGAAAPDPHHQGLQDRGAWRARLLARLLDAPDAQEVSPQRLQRGLRTEALVARLLARDPAGRYPSLHEVQVALRQLLHQR